MGVNEEIVLKSSKKVKKIKIFILLLKLLDNIQVHKDSISSGKWRSDVRIIICNAHELMNQGAGL